MRSLRILQAVTLAGLLTVSATVPAQSGMGKYQQLYANGSVETLSGTIQSVDLVVPPGVKTQAVYVSLQTEKGIVPVQLGPEWFVKKLDTRIEKGDRIEVTGSRIVIEGKSLMLAAQIRKGAQTIVFRSGTGVPVWSGQ